MSLQWPPLPATALSLPFFVILPHKIQRASLFHQPPTQSCCSSPCSLNFLTVTSSFVFPLKPPSALSLQCPACSCVLGQAAPHAGAAEELHLPSLASRKNILAVQVEQITSEHLLQLFPWCMCCFSSPFLLLIFHWLSRRVIFFLSSLPLSEVWLKLDSGFKSHLGGTGNRIARAIIAEGPFTVPALGH